jgi:diacylglycerol kinase (ATP)
MTPTVSGKPRQRFLLFHNERAGPRGLTLVASTTAHLQSRGASVVRHTSLDLFDSHRIAQVPGEFDAVIAAGGDGTIRAIATLFSNCPLPVGIIPQGTGNVLAHEIGLSRSPEQLAAMLMEGQVREVTGGMANGKPFYLMAGAGFDGAVIQRLNFQTKRRFGKAAYVWPVLSALGQAVPQLECEVDGKPLQANWVIVANARHYAGAFDLSAAAGFSAPHLTCFLITARNLPELLPKLSRIALNRLAQSGGVTVLPAQHVVVRSETPVLAQVDGDRAGTTPLDVRYGGVMLRLIYPAGVPNSAA